MTKNELLQIAKKDNWEFYFHLTSPACPEQYDVYSSEEAFLYKEECIGYVRLRWGYLFCEVPFDGEIVYEYQFEDSLQGSMDDDEREFHIEKIKQAIKDYLLSGEND